MGKKFGDNLEMYLHAARMTPSMLEKKTGIDYKRIKRMLANAELPTAKEFASIVNIFNNKPSDWITGMTEEEARDFMRATSNANKPEEKKRNKLTDEYIDTIAVLEPKYQDGEITMKDYCKVLGGTDRNTVLKWRKSLGIDTSSTYGPSILAKRSGSKPVAKKQAEPIVAMTHEVKVSLTRDKVKRMYDKLKDTDRSEIDNMIFNKFVEMI